MIADQQRGAAKVDLAPQFRDTKQFVMRPAKTQGFVSPTGEEKKLQPLDRTPPGALSTSVGLAALTSRRNGACRSRARWR